MSYVVKRHNIHKHQSVYVLSMRFKLLFFLFLSHILSVRSQGPVITRLNGNPNLKNVPSQQSSKRGLNDTISLPFHDDFITTELVPNDLFWKDKQVYVNSTFAISPPSYGVATFDNLNSKGAPYQPLNGNTHNSCDSLTTNPINLLYYTNGASTVKYKIADSIYLSFFYQAQGLGDQLDKTDSLVLKFKDSMGAWSTVWKAIGVPLSGFKQVMLPVLEEKYLCKHFQFRFINFGKSTGNMNQWHVDFITLNSSRTLSDTFVRDVAINAVPVGPLAIYETMPYDHFKVSPSFHTNASHSVTVRNNNTDTSVNVKFAYSIYNQYNQLVFNLPFSSSSRNVPKNSDFTEPFAKPSLDTFSGKAPSFRIEYNINPLALDYLQGDFGSIKLNNNYSKTVRFSNRFAYDDGSAEGGYGLDYGSLPAGPGYAAIKFATSKADTLRGISVFFNRSVADVAFKSFDIMVWKRISEPPANNDDNDIILKQVNLATVIYTDSINGFVDIVFDTAVALEAGEFYIGWKQSINFILNVGYDNNYKYLHSGGRNPNLYYNLNGYWETVNSTITGAPMMRPIVGEPVPKTNTSLVSIEKKKNEIKVYPNPSENSTVLNIEAEYEIVAVYLYDMNGRLLISKEEAGIEELSLESLASGVYILELKDLNGDINRIKISIN